MPQPLAVITLRREPAYRREAFAAGLKRLGYDVICSSTVVCPTFRPKSRNDLLVVWNRKAGMEEKAAEHWEACGGTVIVTENAYLQRVDKSMYAISTHGHAGAGWFPVGDEDRFNPLGFELKPMQDNPNGHILVCGQRGVGSKRMASPPRWGELIAKQTHGARFRPHPGDAKPRIPLTDDLRGAKRCLIWSSATGVRALVEGIPVGHAAPHWICERWEDDRRAALQRMAHGQWSVAEIESGEPFARMRDDNWGLSWV